ncbi:1-phosphofructokinase [Streptomonospora nanhaiensis]|uniref:1-phosphofructokinase n=1 Tax=Streptomonospora nanhaiensis TaxID=1323731 RepID=A0A853BS47_9ACTN|nr:1-phosphofructokinase [Streptomonospora nanhaiensis]MBV2363574.1 1-phosphofructokinase [Streptomonospora nanhaiensis]MBX9391006.1 1-phosphofructokinase [Streptomonospora nanhaiensis]NYI98589.1 1-phosphofructokinase [Streptomonospora nanhaiensis]
MILTCTPNPSVDHTLEVPRLEPGEILRVQSARTQAGGKGVNVSRALRRNGRDTTAVLPVGGPQGAELTALLGDLPCVRVPITDATRTNITVTEADGTTTKLNSSGPALTTAEVEELLAALDAELAREPQWLVASGSLPGGTPPDLYARIGRLAAARGVPVALDTSGKPLEAAAGAGDFALLKPNLEELAELLGRPLETVGDVVGAAREVVSWGNRLVLVTLGAHGALLVDRDRTWWAQGPEVVPRSTVGAGDCSLAGYLSAEGPPEERLCRAVAWGAAAVAMPGTTVPGPEDLRAGEVRLVADPPADWRVADL